MNFFSKSKHAAHPPKPAPSTPSPPPPDLSAPPDTSAPAAPDADASREFLPDPEDAPKKSRFPRIKLAKPQLAKPAFLLRKPATSSPPTEALADLTVTPAPTPDQLAKAARRAARREERTKKEFEWEERERRLRNDAIITGLPFKPSDPLPDFDSASEDEREPPASAHPATAPPAISAVSDADPLSQKNFPPDAPYVPLHPDYMHGPTAQTDAQDVFPGQQRHPSGPIAPPPQPREQNADAQMANMFGAQAYSRGGYAPAGAYDTREMPPVQMSLPSQQYMPPEHQGMGKAEPTPIGWGDVLSVPSQPMFAAPSYAPRGALQVDPMLAARISRGRELARLAVEQEEKGNLGAAENGYMKALELLVPVSKELDVGSELDKAVRMQQKQKIQREAAAMLDRCEEIRLFLKANGPAVPNEMPSVPTSPAEKPVSRKKNTSAPKPPDLDADISTSRPSKSSTTELSRPKPAEPKKIPGPPSRPPPPPPPPAFDGDSGDLFERIASRRNVLSAASAKIHAANDAPSTIDKKIDSGNRSRGGSGSGSEVAKCFVCDAPAELRAKCGHTFCTKCGNQAANVFGACPDRNCNAPLSTSGFDKIL